MSSRRSNSTDKTAVRRELNCGDLKRLNQLLHEAEKHPRVEIDRVPAENSNANTGKGAEERKKRHLNISVESADCEPPNGYNLNNRAVVSSPSSSGDAPTTLGGSKPVLGGIGHPESNNQEIGRSRSDDLGESSDSIGRWTKHEHEQFLKGLRAVGKNWRVIAGEYVTGRTEQQIRTHAAGYFDKIAKLPMMGGIHASRRPSADSVAKTAMLLNNSGAGGSASESLNMSGSHTPFENLMEAVEKAPAAFVSGSRSLSPSLRHMHSMPLSTAMFAASSSSTSGPMPPMSGLEVIPPLQLPINPAAASGMSFPSSQAVAHYNQYMLSIAAQYYQLAAMYQPPPLPVAGAHNTPFAMPLTSALSGISAAGNSIIRQSTLERTGSFSHYPATTATAATASASTVPDSGLHLPNVSADPSEVHPSSTVSGAAAAALAALLPPPLPVYPFPSQPMRVPLLPNIDSIISSAVSTALNQYLPRMVNNPASTLQHASFTHGGEKMKIQFASSVPGASDMLAAAGGVGAVTTAPTAAASSVVATAPAVPPSPASASSSGGGSVGFNDKLKRSRDEEEEEDGSGSEINSEGEGEGQDENQEEQEEDDETGVIEGSKSTDAWNDASASAMTGQTAGRRHLKKKPKTLKELEEWRNIQRRKQAAVLAQEQEKRKRLKEKQQLKEQQKFVRLLATGMPMSMQPPQQHVGSSSSGYAHFNLGKQG